MKKYPIFSLSYTVNSRDLGYAMHAVYINRIGRSRTFYSPNKTLRRRILRALANEPVFGDTDTLTINTTADEFLAGINLLVDPLKAQIALLREALLSLPEWHYLGYCSFCHEKKQDGHDIDCLYQRALEETK